jgi:hypothetical protein
LDATAVARHIGRQSAPNRYLAELRATVNVGQRHASVIRRWKARIDPHLAGLVASTGKRNASPAQLMAEMPALFDMNQWGFSPQQFLEEDKTRGEAAVETGTAQDFLSVIPGTQCVPVARRELGMDLDAYVGLIVHALASGGEAEFQTLHADPAKALEPMLSNPSARGAQAETGDPAAAGSLPLPNTRGHAPKPMTFQGNEAAELMGGASATTDQRRSFRHNRSRSQAADVASVTAALSPSTPSCERPKREPVSLGLQRLGTPDLG